MPGAVDDGGRPADRAAPRDPDRDDPGARPTAFDLDTVTVADLVRASQAEPPGLGLRVSARVASDEAYRAIVATAAAEG